MKLIVVLVDCWCATSSLLINVTSTYKFVIMYIRLRNCRTVLIFLVVLKLC